MDDQKDDTSSNPNNLRPPPTQLHHPSPRPPRSGLSFSLSPLSANSSASSHARDESPHHQSSQDHVSTPPDLPSYVSARLEESDANRGMSDTLPTSPKSANGSATPPHKSRSILNLTSSTLFGIYSNGGYDANRDEPETPWGTGAQTPALRGSGGAVSDANKSLTQETSDILRAKSASGNLPTVLATSRGQPQEHIRRRKPPPRWRSGLGLVTRTVALFALGVTYCAMVTHLHDERNIAPVKVRINRGTWFYMGFWGSLSVALGFLLPWIDTQWDNKDSDRSFSYADGTRRASIGDFKEEEKRRLTRRNTDSSAFSQVDDSEAEQSTAEWNPIVRGVGAFVGIAFAIRRLPWESTLQVSLTLALVNPVLWYLLDRTKAGFTLSLLTGITGTIVMILYNPNIVPDSGLSPSQSPLDSTSSGVEASFTSRLGLVSAERFFTLQGFGVATWILTVFFCSCVCFGNVGRRFTRGIF